MPQALYRRWRPQIWDAVVGQDHVIETLRNAVRRERLAHAYLFAGPRGTGKTTTARLLAKAINCLAENPADRPCNQCAPCLAVANGSFIDLIEIDAASNTSVEDVRALRDKINFSPNEGRRKVYIVDEVHMLSTAAFNALLKTLEEPPDHAVFVLATTEVHKVPPTVLSRCQRHEFRRLPLDVILDFLRSRVADESFAVTEEALELIARQATGSLRDAISLLDQLTSTGQDVNLKLAQVVLGTATDDAVLNIVDAIADGDAAEGLTWINRAIDRGADPRQLARQIVDYLRAVLLVQTGNAALVEALATVRVRMEGHASRLEKVDLMRAIDSFHGAAMETRSGWQPKLPLELAMIESLGPDEPANPAPEPTRPQATAGPAAEPSVQEPTEEGEGNAIDSAGENSPKPAAEDELGSATNLPAGTNHETTGSSAGPLPAGEAITFRHVLDRWDAILAAAFRRDPRCQALLNSGRPLGMESGKLILGFASDLLREKMEMDDNRKQIEAAIEEALGRSVPIRNVLRSQWHEGNPLAQDTRVEEGGMVATAIRDLGATLAEVQPVDDDEEKPDA
jgi:DNA polymerase-3 subunit gamma/tau